jgi:hypothetical protein
MFLFRLPFRGSGFVPTDSMPASLRWFADNQPSLGLEWPGGFATRTAPRGRTPVNSRKLRAIFCARACRP